MHGVEVTKSKMLLVFIGLVTVILYTVGATVTATECPLCHRSVIESTNSTQLLKCLPDSPCANNITLYCSDYRLEDFGICISESCTNDYYPPEFNITAVPLNVRKDECAALFVMLCSGIFQQFLEDCFALCDPATLVDEELKEENSSCDAIAEAHCKTGGNESDVIACAKRCSSGEKCDKLVDCMLAGEFTSFNLAASISMMRMFSKRTEDRIPLALHLRLDTMERLDAALKRRPNIAANCFDRDNSMDFMQMFDEFLDDAEEEEWQTLQQELGYGPSLLHQMENAAGLIAQSPEMFTQGHEQIFQFLGQNIVMNVECTPAGSHYVHNFESSSTGFSSSVTLEVQTVDSGEATALDATCPIVVSTFIAKNLEEYVNLNSSNDTGRVTNTPLVSLQLSEAYSYLQKPIKFTFTHNNEMNISNHICTFWDFDKGDWSTENVTTEVNDTHYICTSSHLTTFAVLVDVTYSEMKFSPALNIVGYIGCSVSIVCLSLTILCFVWFRKSLKKGALLYIHLNLATALLIALVIFVAGIETAKSVNWLCTLVAALLHYLFLCVFCWMLAEGIMLYLLVVRVFGTAAEKWYYLLILGWGLPLMIVAISVGIRHNNYGTTDYCWISVEEGTLWAMVAPMLLIILVNTFFLILTIVSIVNVRRKATLEDATTLNLVTTAVKSTLMLLPLLGLTWIFGLLAVNRNTSVFAWLFTIFNSFQGSFIFVFHALRNEKVFSVIKRKVFMIGSKYTSSKTTTVPLGGASNATEFNKSTREEDEVT